MQTLKKLACSRTLIKIVISMIALILICYLFINNNLNKINHSGDAQALTSSEKLIDYTEESNSIEVYDKALFKNKDIVNILLIGQDKRPGESTARSDSMIIASINKNNSTIKLISLMRDMYVPIPGYDSNKINAAYAFGGMDLLDETIEKNFLINIDGSVEVDFAGFTNVIDKIGGVDIVLNEAEVDYLNKSNNLSLSSGNNHLTGEMALTYSRIRYIGNDDYERTERQRKVLAASFDKLKDLNLKTLLGLANEIFPLITTDFTITEIFGLITGVMLMDVSDIESFRIPADGQFTPETINGMSVLLPNLSENRALLKEYIGY